jgi:putative SOS response-associated peptidase YedK
MCGRFTLRTPSQDIAPLLGLDDLPDLLPRYNIAPSQDVAAVRVTPENQKREVVWLRWGLIPFWAKEPKTDYSTINARAETVATKPTFRQAFQKRRCLIVTDGFYEWQKTDGRKQPFYIHRKDDLPFAFAGLWERWKGDADQIESCTIIVTQPNAVLKPIHDRMPVILSPADFDTWLDPGFADRTTLEALLRPYPPAEFEAYPVTTAVNNPKNDVPQCIAIVKDREPP